MTYQIPNSVNLPPEYDNVTDIFTRMAIYFDLHLHDNPRDDTILYRYVYHLVYMLSCKAKYFQKYSDFDEFALYAAGKIYMRAINGESDIKSILNYIKSVIYQRKVDYQKETFFQIFDAENGTDTEKLREFIAGPALPASRQIDIMDSIIESFDSLPKIINRVIAETPYRADKTMRHRLYVSILLSFVNSLTLPTSTVKRLMGKDKDDLVLKELVKERENADVLLWRLPPTLKNYVILLTRKTKHYLFNDIEEAKKYYEISEEELDAIIGSAYGNVARNDNEEF